ncbi:unnamed protein product [Symbiodinium pilosum]|uniref:Uncharacterized protein n=1 Tax=Symbiodinium pilosum TaxID=2952 RepID=A0A812PWZ2_SYMPI|nr:unnamed protein product [Symbiodinium pilosum]
MAFRLGSVLLAFLFVGIASSVRDDAQVKCKESLVAAAMETYLNEKQKTDPLATKKAQCNWATNGQNPDAREEAVTGMDEKLKKLKVTGCTTKMLEDGLDSYCAKLK